MATYECLLPYCKAIVYDRNGVCEDCWAARLRQLDALPDLYGLCWDKLPTMRGFRPSEITATASPEAGLPINLTIHDALQWAYGKLAAWARWINQKAHGAEYLPAITVTAPRFAQTVRILRWHDTVMGTDPYGGVYVADVHQTYRRLVVLCQPTEPRHLDVTCPVCARTTVLTRHADEYAVCLTCASVWPYSQFPMLRKAPAC